MLVEWMGLIAQIHYHTVRDCIVELVGSTDLPTDLGVLGSA